jgi:prevent-host-death family protein
MPAGIDRAAIDELPPWKLEDAKARLSELVRRARVEGAQRITVYGRDAVVVVAADEYARLTVRAEQDSLGKLLAGSPLARLTIEPAAERSPVREVEL